MKINHITVLKFNSEESKLFDKAFRAFDNIISEMEKNNINLITGEDNGDSWGLEDFQNTKEVLLFLVNNDGYILEQGESS